MSSTLAAYTRSITRLPAARLTSSAALWSQAQRNYSQLSAGAFSSYSPPVTARPLFEVSAGSNALKAPLTADGGLSYSQHPLVSSLFTQAQSSKSSPAVQFFSTSTSSASSAQPYSPPIFSQPLNSNANANANANANGDDDNDGKKPSNNSTAYSWIDDEAHELIQKAYTRHKALQDKSQSFPPSLSVKDLERIGTPYSFPPQDFVDRLALNMMKFLRVFVHGFFREKYDHHAVCLETVAAVPGLVASFHRHLRSLRRMKRDHGWISILQEEAENERMHLLIFMKVCQPTMLERSLVLVAQGIYLTFYSTLYLVNSRAAHRLTGYLEEEAHRAYTDYLACIDAGKIPNVPAPFIAKKYYSLPDDATMRDVVLHVRADEAMHRDVNHHFGNMYAQGRIDEPVDSY